MHIRWQSSARHAQMDQFHRCRLISNNHNRHKKLQDGAT